MRSNMFSCTQQHTTLAVVVWYGESAQSVGKADLHSKKVLLRVAFVQSDRQCQDTIRSAE